MRGLRVVAGVLVGMLLSTWLAAMPARAEVFTGQVMKLSDYAGSTVQLPDAKVGVPYVFKVIDASGRAIPVWERGHAEHYWDTTQTFSTGSSLYHTSSGRRTMVACVLLSECVTLTQNVTGTTLPGKNPLLPRRTETYDRWRVGETLSAIPPGVDLTKGKLHVQWYRDRQPILGDMALTHRLTMDDFRVHVGATVFFLVPGKRPMVGEVDDLVVTQQGVPYGQVLPGDLTGDGLADFLVFGTSSTGGSTVQMWRTTRTGRSVGGPVRFDWTSAPRGASLVVQTGRRNTDASELWWVRSSCLMWGELQGAGVIDYMGNCAGSGWTSVNALVPLNDQKSKTMTFMLARRKADGALLRYTPTVDASGFTSMQKATQVGWNWGGMKFITSPGDVTGDGIADVVAVRADGTLWQYQGRANGTIGSARQVGHGWLSFDQLFSPGDMTGDGRPDLVGRRSDGTVFLYANKLGSWGAPRVLITGLSNVRVMA